MRYLACLAALAITPFTEAQDGEPRFEMGSMYLDFSGMAVQTFDSDVAVAGVGVPFNSDFDTSAGLTIGFGIDWHVLDDAMISTELEFSYRNSPIGDVHTPFFPVSLGVDGDLDTLQLMLNIIWDNTLIGQGYTGFGYYAGVGVGIAWSDLDVNSPIISLGGDSSEFAWQGMVGLRYRWEQNWTVYTGFRYFDSGSPDIGIVSLDNEAIAWETGLQFRF